MSKLKIEKSESITTTPCTTSLSIAELLEVLKLPGDATVTLVGANGGVELGDERIVVQFEQRATRKPRKSKAAA